MIWISAESSARRMAKISKLQTQEELSSLAPLDVLELP
jgi:hypothetical protein